MIKLQEKHAHHQVTVSVQTRQNRTDLNPEWVQMCCCRCCCDSVGSLWRRWWSPSGSSSGRRCVCCSGWRLGSDLWAADLLSAGSPSWSWTRTRSDACLCHISIHTSPDTRMNARRLSRGPNHCGMDRANTTTTTLVCVCQKHTLGRTGGRTGSLVLVRGGSTAFPPPIIDNPGVCVASVRNVSLFSPNTGVLRCQPLLLLFHLERRTFGGQSAARLVHAGKCSRSA